MDHYILSINEKLLLTPKEASEYSNIGINRILSMLRSPYCTFALHNGNRTLVKRKEFEEYIAGTDDLEL